MRKISDNSRSDSGGDCAGESPNSGDGAERFANIKSANRKVRLIDILRGCGIKIEKNYQWPEWSNNITCPLPTHKGAKERTPSFAYNFVSDHFNCLGCNQSGQAVEFLSLYEGTSRTSVAEKILAKYVDDVDFEDDNDYVDNISPVLFDVSKRLQKLIQKHRNDHRELKWIDTLIWWLDFHLMIALPNKRVTSENLKSRIDRIRKLI
jgi:hypothetical protein